MNCVLHLSGKEELTTHMLILLVQNHVPNDSDAKELLSIVMSKLPNASIELISYKDALDIGLNVAEPVILLIQNCIWATNLAKPHLDVIVWRDLPDMSTQLDMFLQLQRYKEQYPLSIKGWTLKEVLNDSDEAVVYRAVNNSGDKAAIKQFKFRPSMLTKNKINQAIKNIKTQCGEKSRGLVHIFEGGVSNQAFYLIMEYLKYGTLRQALNDCGNSLPLIHALEWFQEIVVALDCVHKSGFIHRDLKIDNILLRSDGSLALIDYGISKRILLDAGFVSEQQLDCSPYYVSPEQLSGSACSRASDIYSLGVIFFELLAGRKPYEASEVHDLMMLHVMAPVPVLPDELSQFQHLIDKMMAKDPDDRFTSVLDAIENLPIAA